MTSEFSGLVQCTPSTETLDIKGHVTSPLSVCHLYYWRVAFYIGVYNTRTYVQLWTTLISRPECQNTLWNSMENYFFYILEKPENVCVNKIRYTSEYQTFNHRFVHVYAQTQTTWVSLLSHSYRVWFFPVTSYYQT